MFQRYATSSLHILVQQGTRAGAVPTLSLAQAGRGSSGAQAADCRAGFMKARVGSIGVRFCGSASAFRLHPLKSDTAGALGLATFRPV